MRLVLMRGWPSCTLLVVCLVIGPLALQGTVAQRIATHTNIVHAL